MISNTLTSMRIALAVPLWLLLATTAAPQARWWALAVFLLSGLTDVLDGFLARKLGETSRFGAMLDLVADRLLTVVTLGALITSGELPAWGAAAALVLIARDLVVASLNEALPGRLEIRVSAVERVKIALHFLAVAVLIAPSVWRPAGGVDQHMVGSGLLACAAVLALATVADYWLRALKAFRLA